MFEITEDYIKEHIIKNDSLFNYITVIHQNFDIQPNNKKHYGAHISYQDISELQEDFLNELYDSIIGWVYSTKKYDKLKQDYISKGKDESAAVVEIMRKANQKFRKPENVESILVQGQFGELLLFHFIQRFFHAIPILRKMSITTSSKIERFGADAIHYRLEKDKNIFIFGEAKTYTSDYRFNDAFKDAVNSILETYGNHRKELDLYLHEDFLDDELDMIVEKYRNNTLQNSEVHLVSIVVYNENKKINITNEDDIKKQIKQIICDRFNNYNNEIPIKDNHILTRITYIVFPIWKLKDLMEKFQRML